MQDKLDYAQELLFDFFEILDEREQDILLQRYMLKKTLKQVGEKFGINQSRVREIQMRALNKLNISFKKKLKEYLLESVMKI